MVKTPSSAPAPPQDTPDNKIDEFASSLQVTEMVFSWVGLRVIYSPRPAGIISFIKQEWLYIVSMAQLSSTVVGELIHWFSVLGQSFLEVTALAPCIGFCCLGVCKIYAVSSKRHLVQELAEELQALWPVTEDLPPNHIKIIKTSLKRLRSTTLFFFWSYVALICFFNSAPLFGMAADWINTRSFKRNLPYLIWYPFNEYRDGIYQLIFIYQMWSGFIAAIANVGPDCMFQVSCSHICMLLKILQDELLKIIPCPEIEDSVELIKNENEVYEQLKSIVQRHQKLIKLSNDMETIYSFGIMINLVCGSFIICLVGFQATASNSEQLIKFTLFLWASLVQVLILSWYGNHLIDSSVGMAHAAWHCRWYLASKRFKVMLHILFLRSQRPLTVTAYKFSDISLNTFTSMIKTSWSYFTLLKAVYDPNS